MRNRHRLLLCAPLLALLFDTQSAFAGTIYGFDSSGNVTSAAADATTAYSYNKTNIAASGLLVKKASAASGSVLDDVVAETIRGAEKAAGAAAAGAAGGAIRGAAGGLWGSVLGGLAGAIGSAALALGADKLVSWLFNQDGTITASQGPTPLTKGSDYWVNGKGVGSTPVDAWEANLDYLQATNQYNYASTGCVEQSSTTWNCTGTATSRTSGVVSSMSVGSARGSNGGWNCASGRVSNGTCESVTGAMSTSSPPASASDAVSAVPASELTQPVDPTTMADYVDGLWQNASHQSGYSGVPYDATNPVTADDVTDWMAANPDYAPTVGDAIGTTNTATTAGSSPAGEGAQAMPIPNTAGSADPTAGVNPSTATTSPSTGTGTSSGTGTATGSGTQSGTGTGTGSGSGTGTGTSTGTSSGSDSTPSDTSTFCQIFPNASACAALGTPASAVMATSSAAVSLSPVSIGGVSASAAVCPADRTLSFFGASVALPYTPICDFVGLARPVIMLIFACVAAYIFIAGVKS